MSAETVDRTLIVEFSDAVHHEVQQTKPRLKGKVIEKKMSGDSWAYDGLGDVEAVEVFSRLQPAEFHDIEHKRRKIARRRFYVNLGIDGADIRGQILNQKSEYAKAVANAMARVYDRVVLEAQFASVLTGQNFGTTVTYATDSGYTAIDATAGLTYEKLIETMKGFIDNEVGNDLPESFYLGHSGDEHEDMMLETELTSGDFSRNFVVDKGQITMAAGFELVKYGASVSNPMLTESGGERTCFAASTRAMCVGLSKEVGIEIQKRNDYIEVDQVMAVFELGAVRTEGKLIQKIRTTA